MSGLVATAIAIAVSAFGPTICGGGTHPAVYVTDLPSNVIGYADTRACEIDLDLDNEPLTREKLCTTIVHEYGHLAGYAHSSDPNDIMYPAESGYLPGVYPPCRGA